DDVQPRRVTTAQPANAAFVGSDHVLASFGADKTATWIDVATGNAAPVGRAPALHDAVAPPNGRVAIAIDLAHHARLVSPGRDPEDLGNVDFARFVDDDHAALASSDDGAIEMFDLTNDRRTALARRDGKLVGLAAGHGVIAAVYADGAVFRHDVASAAELTRPTKPPPTGPIVVATNGDIVFAAGSELRVLRGDRIAPLATLARNIDKLAVVDAGVVAITADGSEYVVGDTAGTPMMVGLNASISATGLSVVATQGRIDVVDPIARQRFPLAMAGNLPYFYPQISADAHYVVASTARGLLVWHLDLPALDDVPAWLDHITNISSARTP
ncbi:MAG TPA: hypothetical protein VGO00_26255, partial [Kofleriaceae bacterium]|nr:hypothetical protein [Kofleriaceae bacterium]